jgi:hypothetical protein
MTYFSLFQRSVMLELQLHAHYTHLRHHEPFRCSSSKALTAGAHYVESAIVIRPRTDMIISRHLGKHYGDCFQV